jgi:hypothetical protein
MSQQTARTQQPECELGHGLFPDDENEISAEEVDAIRISWSVLEPYLVGKFKEQGYSDCIGRLQSGTIIDNMANSGLSKEKVSMI